jgi:putative transposase
VDLLRGRGRPDAAPAEGPHLGPPRAHPVVRVPGKGSGRVSVAGLACYKPGQTARLFYRTRIHRERKGERKSLSEADYAELITAAHNQLHAPVILIRDTLNTHMSGKMRSLSRERRDWLTVIQMPSYARDLNPVEGAWANMKNGLGNLAARTLDQLAAVTEPARPHSAPPGSHRRIPGKTGLSLEPEPPL